MPWPPCARPRGRRGPTAPGNCAPAIGRPTQSSISVRTTFRGARHSGRHCRSRRHPPPRRGHDLPLQPPRLAAPKSALDGTIRQGDLVGLERFRGHHRHRHPRIAEQFSSQHRHRSGRIPQFPRERNRAPTRWLATKNPLGNRQSAPATALRTVRCTHRGLVDAPAAHRDGALCRHVRTVGRIGTPGDSSACTARGVDEPPAQSSVDASRSFVQLTAVHVLSFSSRPA